MVSCVHVTDTRSVLIRAGRLAEAGEPFALATVVRVERPASARVGDRALLLPGGSGAACSAASGPLDRAYEVGDSRVTVVGWVGGACSEPSVVREALAALADGEPRLVRVGPAESCCASEGTVDVLVEPQLPASILAVVGESPAARALAEVAALAGWRVERAVGERADAVVVATMGREDVPPIEAALAAGAGYVGLVASGKRAAAVVAELRARGVAEEGLARVFSPAGLDLGPSTQPEIAIAVMAELVAWRHRRLRAPLASPEEAVDPVCGMAVAVAAGAESTVRDGATYYFCCAGCRARFEADPAAF